MIILLVSVFTLVNLQPLLYNENRVLLMADWL